MDMRYTNPSTLPCWETCGSCFRCIDKGRYTKCNECSGRHDPYGRTEADPDDFCDCRNGVLRWRTKDGQLVVRRINHNPYRGQVITDSRTQDERDWDAYLQDVREKMDNPNYDPIKVIS